MTTDRIQIQEVYSIEDCVKYKHKLYVFGDNLLRIGKGGQAVIRDCKNTFGIPTKCKPDMTEDSFFHDSPFEMTIVEGNLIELLYRYYNINSIFVFPKNGLGTGLAKLKEKSPKINKLINDFLINHFNIHIQP